MKRNPNNAGTFYPSEKKELETTIKKLLSQAKPVEITGDIKALIVPHAGYEYSGIIAASAFNLLKNKDYKNIILLGPSHRYQFEDLALGTYTHWETPLGEIPASKIGKKLLTSDYFKELDDAHDLEHSIEVQLPFLQTVLPEVFITPIAAGQIKSHDEIAKKIEDILDDSTLLLISSDLSHYQYYEDAEDEDKHTLEEILRLEDDISHDEACGADSIKVLIKIAKDLNWKPVLIDYKNSGDITNSKDEVVGYGAVAFVN